MLNYEKQVRVTELAIKSAVLNYQADIFSVSLSSTQTTVYCNIVPIQI